MLELDCALVAPGHGRAAGPILCGGGQAESILVEVCASSQRGRLSYDDTVLYVARGAACTLTTAEDVLALGPRDVCLLQPGTEHDVLQGGEPPLRIVLRHSILHGHFLPVASGCPLLLEFLVQGLNHRPAMPYLLFSYHGKGDISADVDRLCAEYEEQGSGYETVLICTLVNIMITLSRSYWLQAQVADFSAHGKLALILDYMSDHSAEATLESTAAQFNYHPNTISALLKRELGKTFSEVIREYRLERAGILLATTDMPVEQVAPLCGYEHLGNFYRIFKSYFGVTPGLYAHGERAARGTEGLHADVQTEVDGRTRVQSERSLAADLPTCVPNFRDLGGKRTASGGFVREGLIYRSGGLCELAELGPGSLRERGIRSVYDLRQGGECLSERGLPLAGAQVHRLLAPGATAWKPAKGLSAGLISDCGRPGAHMLRNYRAAALTYRDAFATVFSVIARGELPLIFCCRNGRDRAGILAAVILKLLDVPDDAIMEDYLKSNAELRERNDTDFRRMSDGMTAAEMDILRSFFEAREEYLGAFWRGVAEEYGSFERYVTRGLGVTAGMRERVERWLVD